MGKIIASDGPSNPLIHMYLLSTSKVLNVMLYTKPSEEKLWPYSYCVIAICNDNISSLTSSLIMS